MEITVRGGGRLRNLAVIVDLHPHASEMTLNDDEGGDPVVVVLGAGGRSEYKLGESTPELVRRGR